MTYKEIEKYRQRLIKIRNLDSSGERNKAYIELSAELGASGPGRDTSPGESQAVYIQSINHAIQTATMIEMCRTATDGYEMATKATSRASKQSWISAAIAFISAVAAAVSAVAACVLANQT